MTSTSQHTPVVEARASLGEARRVVVKIGSALLADASSGPFGRFAAQIFALRRKNIDVVLVSSGAIALGLSALRLSERPRDLPTLQACAAAGQSRLMQRWAEAFGAFGLDVAQILLTHPDFEDRRRYLNARQSLLRLLQAGIVPIINENDVVAVEEIKLGDNDTLAARVCGLVDADTVVLLTGAPGLYTADPGVDPTAQRVPVVHDIDERIRAMAGGAAKFGTGGMITKLDAAIAARRHGASTLIVPGRVDDVLPRSFSGDDIGTLFLAPPEERGSAKKRWIATALRPRGVVIVDDGAAQALRTASSLLPAGVREIDGDFEVGDPVDIASSSDRKPFARALARMDAKTARRVAGKKTADARALLEAAGEGAISDEVVHRDDLVLL